MCPSELLPFGDHEASRRKGPRIEVLGQLHGQFVALEMPVLIRNLGAGGFGLEASMAFPVASVQKFRFTTATGTRVVVSAEVKHCHPVQTTDGTARYRSGFIFVHEPGGVTIRAIEALLDASTATPTEP
jgi:hypothetical protein